MPRAKPFPAELRERAVRMVLDHQHEYRSRWEAICAVAGNLGASPETVRKWVRRELGEPRAVPESLLSADAQRIRELERENRELRRANEILKAASAFFARELDPQPPN